MMTELSYFGWTVLLRMKSNFELNDFFFRTYCPVCSSSPYSHPSRSSWISSVIMSPSSKLSRVWLFPAVWGKIVCTLLFLATSIPLDTDADLDRLFPSRLS